MGVKGVEWGGVWRCLFECGAKPWWLSEETPSGKEVMTESISSRDDK